MKTDLSVWRGIYPDRDIQGAVTDIGGTIQLVCGDGDNISLTKLDQARAVATSRGWASTSLLQRIVWVGFAEAYRLLDALSAEGTLEPGNDGKARAVITREENP